jgi:hypothetical protein
MSRTPIGKPSFERSLRLIGGLAGNKGFDADVLVHYLPVNACASAYQLPGVPLSFRRILESWIPGKRHGDRAAIPQFNDQDVIRHVNANGKGLIDLFS